MSGLHGPLAEGSHQGRRKVRVNIRYNMFTIYSYFKGTFKGEAIHYTVTFKGELLKRSTNIFLQKANLWGGGRTYVNIIKAYFFSSWNPYDNCEIYDFKISIWRKNINTFSYISIEVFEKLLLMKHFNKKRCEQGYKKLSLII